MKGGTMRLGSYPCKLKLGSMAHRIYGEEEINERHRHRFEVNSHYLPQLADAGLRAAGMSPDGLLPETIELDGHRWFFGCQFHPEYKSKPINPHPVFVSFVRAALDFREVRESPKAKKSASKASRAKSRGKKGSSKGGDADAELAGSLLQVSPGGVSAES